VTQRGFPLERHVQTQRSWMCGHGGGGVFDLRAILVEYLK